MIKVIMHGCNGKMGQMISGLIAADEEIELVAGIDAYDEGKNPYPVFKNIKECDVAADAIIDFSTASAVDGLLDYCVEKKLPAVVCTTGLSEEQIVTLKEASKKVAILKSANMSLGINMLLKLLKDATAVLAPAGFDIEIVEKHHNQKLDAPSGTALALAGAVREARPELRNRCGREGQCPRTQEEIGIHSLRMGNAAGEHTVVFSTPTQTLYLGHKAHSRALYAEGALRAAAFLMAQKPGLYSMKEMLR